LVCYSGTIPSDGYIDHPDNFIYVDLHDDTIEGGFSVCVNLENKYAEASLSNIKEITFDFQGIASKYLRGVNLDQLLTFARFFTIDFTITATPQTSFVVKGVPSVSQIRKGDLSFTNWSYDSTTKTLKIKVEAGDPTLTIEFASPIQGIVQALQIGIFLVGYILILRMMAKA